MHFSRKRREKIVVKEFFSVDDIIIKPLVLCNFIEHRSTNLDSIHFYEKQIIIQRILECNWEAMQFGSVIAN